MALSDLLTLIGVVVAVIAIGVQVRSARPPRHPEFQVTHHEDSQGWTVTAYNTGQADAYWACFELVDHPDGRIKTLKGGDAQRVAVDGRLDAAVQVDREITGRALDLVWLDSRRTEHRYRISLPSSGAAGRRGPFRGGKAA
jgi:hypothetical protein